MATKVLRPHGKTPSKRICCFIEPFRRRFVRFRIYAVFMLIFILFLLLLRKSVNSGRDMNGSIEAHMCHFGAVFGLVLVNGSDLPSVDPSSMRRFLVKLAGTGTLNFESSVHPPINRG